MADELDIMSQKRKQFQAPTAENYVIRILSDASDSSHCALDFGDPTAGSIVSDG